MLPPEASIEEGLDTDTGRISTVSSLGGLGVDSDGERYLELRRRLVLYFDRKNCLAADDLADETLNRVAQKFQEQGEITNISPAHYCYVVAKFVFLENLRRVERSHSSIDDSPDPSTPPGRNTSRKRETRCLTALTAA